MVVIAFDGFSRFLKADVVEPGEGSPVDVFDSVVGDEKHFLPPHEHKVGAVKHVVIESVQIKRLRVLKEAEKFSPMLSVHFLVGVPFTSQKGKFVADDFAHETGRKRAEFFRQTVNLARKRKTYGERVNEDKEKIDDGEMADE